MGSIRLKGFGKFYALLVHEYTAGKELHTPDLLEALAMDLADCVVLLLQAL